VSIDLAEVDDGQPFGTSERSSGSTSCTTICSSPRLAAATWAGEVR
jgi:hypothetical protein